MNQYALINGRIVPVPLGSPFQPIKERCVASTQFGAGEGPLVSTAFLAINHNFAGGAPILFETMVFWPNDEHDGDMERYHTLDDALEGHQRMVATIQEAIDDRTGALDTTFAEIDRIFGLTSPPAAIEDESPSEQV